MKQVIQNNRRGTITVGDVPAPMGRAGWVVVANRVSLISAGTEKSSVAVAQKNLIGKAVERPDLARKVLDAVRKNGVVATTKMVLARLEVPSAPGYSCAGTVLEVGEGVEGLSVGDRAACAGQNYASHAEIVAVPKNLCVRLPAGVEFDEGAFVTVGAIALQGVRQAEPRLGDRVAVIGLGLLGQLTVQLLKASGCAVLASDPEEWKRDLAKALGADMVAPPDALAEAAAGLTQGHGVDAAVITAATKDSGPVNLAAEISRRKGRVVVVGAVGMALDREPYYRKELELRLSTSYGPGRYDPVYEEQGQDYPYAYVRWTERRNMEAFLAQVAQRKVDVRRLVTHRSPIAEADRAYARMMEGGERYLGMLIDYPGDAPPLRRVIAVAPGRPVAGLRLGLIGAGNHVQDMLLPRLAAMKGVRVSAVCTGTGLRAKALADRIGAASCTTDYREVLADSAVDAVLIGTRHHLHGPIVLDALRAGKHVFVEKPLCLTHEELDEIAGVYAKTALDGIHLTVGFNRRFSPHMDRARAFFQGRANPLVMIFRVNAGPVPAEHWIQDPAVGGGRILGEACHFVDYMQALCGAPPVSVHANRIGRHGSGMTDDQCILAFEFDDGSVGTVVYAAGGDARPAKERFEAFGDGKSLVMDDFIASEFYARGTRTVFKSGARDKGFHAEMTRFVEAVTRGGPAPIPFGELYAVTTACLRAVESLRTGRPCAIEGVP